MEGSTQASERKQAVLFDLDGTLWDSTSAVARSWNEIFAKTGLKEEMAEEEIESLMGLPMDEIARRVFPEEEQAQADQKLKLCTDHENEYLAEHGGLLYKDLEPVLKDLKNRYFLAIVSNCQSGYIEAFLKAHRLEGLFDDFECFGNNDLPKADNIKAVVERNGIQEALYLGDIEGDHQAAVLAGIPFIHAAYGFGTVLNVPAIHHLRELPEAVEKVFRQDKD